MFIHHQRFRKLQELSEHPSGSVCGRTEKMPLSFKAMRLPFATLLATGLLAGAMTVSMATQAVADEALAVLVPGSGDYSRSIPTDSETAQTYFDQGLRLTWGFYFPEAIASFQEALRHDPDNPVIHFAKAFAIGPNPNSRYSGLPDDPHGTGLAAIQRAMDLIDRAPQKEQDMIRALWVLYDRDAIPDSDERDQAFLQAGKALFERYPDDPDIATIYAATYMFISRWDYWHRDGSPKPGTTAATDALEHAIRVSPYHPGANHMYIHMMESSMEPELALASAHRLEAISPIVGHMVHMPGHIYLRTGDYEKAIYMNERSQIVDRQFAGIWGDTQMPMIGTYNLSHRGHAMHALDFVRYAAFLQGTYDTAIEAAERGASMVTREAAARGGGVQKRVVSAWLVDKAFGKWDRLLAAEQSHGDTPYLDGMWQYVVGSAYANTGQLDRAREALSALQAQVTHENVDRLGVGPTPASTILQIAAYGLEGEILEAAGELDRAVYAFRQAVELEDQNSYIEPPDWQQPMRHYLGAALLAADRPAEAEAVYRDDLAWHQQNGWSTFGLMQSLEAQDREEEALILRRKFDAIWRNADVTLTRSRF